MSRFFVRSATPADDLLAIAACLYLTDPFIYPTAFGENAETAARAIARLMAIPESVLSIQNIYVAVDGDRICGVLLFNQCGTAWDTAGYYEQIKNYIDSRENFEYAAEHYFTAVAKPPKQNHVEIVAVCTCPEYRQKGVAQLLLSRFAEEKAPLSLCLDVLANNAGAIRLYSRLGFSVVDQFHGFNAPGKPRPACYRMIRP